MELSQLLYWLIIAFILLDAAIALWLTTLEIKASKWPVPKILEGLYDISARKPLALAGG